MRDFPPTFQSISRQMDTGRKLDNFQYWAAALPLLKWGIGELTGNWNSGSNLCISRSYSIGHHPHTVRFQAMFYIFIYIYICLDIYTYLDGFWRYFDRIFEDILTGFLMDFLRYCDQWQSKSILGNVRRSSPQNVSSNPHYTNNPHTLILTTNTNYFLNSATNVVVMYNQCTTQCNTYTLWFLT